MQKKSTEETVATEYEPPTVTVLGDLHELTLGGLGTSPDGLGAGAGPSFP